jgi:hypothetical protein
MKTVGLRPISSLSHTGLAAAFGVLLAAIGASGLISDQAIAQGTPEQRQACQPDAMRLCSEFVPDVDRITACMIKQRMRLSPACRAVFQTPSHGKPKSFKRTS